MRKWLDKVSRLRIAIWSYHWEPERRHIGPMADEWQRVTGFSDGINIDGMDAIGIALKCIQELDTEVKALRREVAELRDVVRNKAKDNANRSGARAA